MDMERWMPEMVPVEADLDQEWKKQARRLVALGADKELGFATPEEYLATLPKFSPKPEGFEGRFDRTGIQPQAIASNKLIDVASDIGIDT